MGDGHPTPWKGHLPGWSPDSKYVGFGSYATSGDHGLWMLNVQSGKVRKVLDGNLTLPRWSPDGTKLAYDDRVKLRVEIVNLDQLELP